MAKMWDDFTKGLGDAITDIRQKVVEEPWYGRTVTEQESPALQWPAAKQPEAGDSFGSLTQEKEVDQDRGLER